MFASGVKFKLTLDMCNSLLFYMHNYVKFIFSRLSVEEHYLPQNYYLLLYNNIFENRTEQTIQNLYNILNNYILEKNSGASSCNYHLTQVRCVCLQKLGYVQEGTSDICLKSVKDPAKVREHTMALFSYLLSYKQLYRLKCGEGYDAYLQERLSKLRNFMFDSVFIGFDELISSSRSIRNIQEEGYYNVSDFMRALYNSLNSSSAEKGVSNLVSFYASNLASYNLLLDIFIIRGGNLYYRYPYNLLNLVLVQDTKRVLSLYFTLHGTDNEEILMDFLFWCLSDVYHRDRFKYYYGIMRERYKDGNSKLETCKRHSLSKDWGRGWSMTSDRLSQIENYTIKSLRALIYHENLLDSSVLLSKLSAWVNPATIETLKEEMLSRKLRMLNK